MYNLKIFAQNEKELETLIKIIRINSQDIGTWHLNMDHADNEGCKKSITERIELPNQKSIIMLWEKENYKYLGILEADIIIK